MLYSNQYSTNEWNDWTDVSSLFLTIDQKNFLNVKTPIYKVCSYLPKQAVRKGWILSIEDPKLSSEVIAVLQDKVENILVRLGFKKKLRELLIRSRQYGGACLILETDDKNHMSEPLHYKSLKRIKGIHLLDRYQIRPEWMKSQNPEEPDYYEIFNQFNFNEFSDRPGYIIHPSRVLRADGVETPPDVKELNDGWGLSVPEQLSEAYRKYVKAEELFLDALNSKLVKLGIHGLRDALSGDNNETERTALSQRLSKAFAQAKKDGAIAYDPDYEDFEFTVASPGYGNSELMEHFKTNLQALGDISHTVLWGESSSGNLGAVDSATRHNDLQAVSEYQESISYILDRFYYILFRCKRFPFRGYTPQRWTYSFLPLDEKTPQEQVELATSSLTLIQELMNNQLLSKSEARASLKLLNDNLGLNLVFDDKVYEQQQKSTQSLASNYA